MNVRATLVIGADGSTSFLGSSDGVTSPADRARFLATRRQGDVIIIGGNTARHERYRRTPVPLVVLSHTYPEIVAENPKAHWWNLSPSEAVRKAKEEFGPSIYIEGGVAMIHQLLPLGLISRLDLSVTPMSGGENRTDLAELLSYFNAVEQNNEDDTIFYSCTQPMQLMAPAPITKPR
jgi:dihydrofolate reductase